MCGVTASPVYSGDEASTTASASDVLSIWNVAVAVPVKFVPLFAVSETVAFPAFTLSVYFTSNEARSVMISVPSATVSMSLVTDGLIASPVYTNDVPFNISSPFDISAAFIANVFETDLLYPPIPTMLTVAVPTFMLSV